MSLGKGQNEVQNKTISLRDRRSPSLEILLDSLGTAENLSHDREESITKNIKKATTSCYNRVSSPLLSFPRLTRKRVNTSHKTSAPKKN